MKKLIGYIIFAVSLAIIGYMVGAKGAELKAYVNKNLMEKITEIDKY